MGEDSTKSGLHNFIPMREFCKHHLLSSTTCDNLEEGVVKSGLWNLIPMTEICVHHTSVKSVMPREYVKFIKVLIDQAMRVRVSNTSSVGSDNGVPSEGEQQVGPLFLKKDDPTAKHCTCSNNNTKLDCYFNTGKDTVDNAFDLKTSSSNFFFSCEESKNHGKMNRLRVRSLEKARTSDSDWHKFTFVCHRGIYPTQVRAYVDLSLSSSVSNGLDSYSIVAHQHGRPKFVIIVKRIGKNNDLLGYAFLKVCPGASEMQVLRRRSINKKVGKRKRHSLLGKVRIKVVIHEGINTKLEGENPTYLVSTKNIGSKYSKEIIKAGTVLKSGIALDESGIHPSFDNINNSMKVITEGKSAVGTGQGKTVVIKEEVKNVLDSLSCPESEIGKALTSKHQEEEDETRSLLSTSERSSANLLDILVDPGFKMKPQTLIVGNVGGASTAVGGIPWSRLNEERWRLHTFARYPHNAAKSAILLAEEGFAYNGTGVDSDDSVICCFCTSSKRGWREDENIRETHRGLNPTCPIVSGARCNNVPMKVPTNVSFTSSRNSSSARGAAGQANNEGIREGSEASRPTARFSPQGAQALPANPNTRSLQNRKRVKKASSTQQSPADSGHSTDRAARYQVPRNTFNPLQATDDGPSSTVTSNDHGPAISTSQSTEASPALGNNNISQTTPTQNNSNTHGSPQTANQSGHVAETNQPAPTSQTNQSTPNSTVNQTNTQPNNPQTAPANQPNSQETNPPGNPQNPTYYQLGIITERPKRHEYAVRLKRLDTFGDWPAGHHLKKEDLADAGFYYAGYGDCARCFYCGGGLRNWELGDDVWVEHARWFPKCAYIRQRVGQVFIDTVAYFAQDHEKITFKMVVDKLGVDPAAFQIDSKETPLKTDPAVVTVKGMGYKEDEIVRAATLHKENNQILSADELYETLQTTGAIRHSDGNQVYVTMKPSRDMQTDKETLDTIKQKNSDLRLQYLCKVCMDKEVAIVFLPCGHLVCCTECSSAMRDCPVCRKQVKGVVRGFMA